MSLSEETLSVKNEIQMPFTSCGSAVDSLRHERIMIRLKTAMFIRNGGKIKTGEKPKPVSETTNVEADMAKKRKRAHTSVASKMFVNTPLSFHDGKNRANDRASSGHQNIKECHRKRGTVYQVLIGKSSYGSYDKLQDAITKRDAQREILGMEKAFY